MGDGTACLENGGGSVGEPKVRIHLPPAGSLQTFGPSRVAAIESVAEPETRAADHAVKSRLAKLERPRHDKSKMLRNARRCPPSKRGRAMSTVLPFPAGGYRFIAHQFQYSGGVAAEPGFRFERARFTRPVPLAEGFDAIEAYLGGIGRSPTAFCACELLSPAQFTDAGFVAFNRHYVERLAGCDRPENRSACVTLDP